MTAGVDWGQLAAELTNDDLPPGDFAGSTKLTIERWRLLGVDKINTPEDAAKAFCYLTRYTTERLEGLLTNSAGEPLAIIGALVGNRHTGRVYAENFISEAFRIKNAVNIWFGHNHPAGINKFSYSDRLANALLTDAFFGSGIRHRGFLAVAGMREQGVGWVYAPAQQSLYYEPRGHSPQDGDLCGFYQPAAAFKAVPIVELVYAHEGAIGPRLRDPLSHREKLALTKGQSGFFLLNQSSFPLAFVPLLNSAAAENLRFSGILDSLYRAISVANPSYALLINHGELSEKAIENLFGFFKSTNVYVLDVLGVGKPKLSSLLEDEATRAKYYANLKLERFYQGSAEVGRV
jgi:RadC-like JAB domain